MLDVGSWSRTVLTRLPRRRTVTTNAGCEVRVGATLSRDRRTAIDQQCLPRDQVRAFDKTHHELRDILRLADVLQGRRAALTGARCLEHLLAEPLPQPARVDKSGRDA